MARLRGVQSIYDGPGSPQHVLDHIKPYRRAGLAHANGGKGRDRGGGCVSHMHVVDRATVTAWQETGAGSTGLRDSEVVVS